MSATSMVLQLALGAASVLPALHRTFDQRIGPCPGAAKSTGVGGNPHCFAKRRIKFAPDRNVIAEGSMKHISCAQRVNCFHLWNAQAAGGGPRRKKHWIRTSCHRDVLGATGLEVIEYVRLLPASGRQEIRGTDHGVHAPEKFLCAILPASRIENN